MRVNTTQLQNKFYPIIDRAVDQHYHGRTAARIKRAFEASVLSNQGFNKKGFYSQIEALTSSDDPRVTAKTISGIKSDFMSSVSDVKSSITVTPKKKTRTFTQTSNNSNTNRIFHAQDFTYTGYKGKDIADLQFAENCCKFPKLALLVSKKAHIDIHTACQRINHTERKLNNPSTLTLKQVTKLS